LAENTYYEPLCVVIGPAVWPGHGAKNTQTKNKQRVEPKHVTNWVFAPPTPLIWSNEIWHMGWAAGRVSKIWVSGRSVNKCQSCGGSKFAFSHWQGWSLIQQLVATAQAVMCTCAFHWYQNQWPWVTPDPGFTVAVSKIGDFRPLSRQYLKNGW